MSRLLEQLLRELGSELGVSELKFSVVVRPEHNVCVPDRSVDGPPKKCVPPFPALEAGTVVAAELVGNIDPVHVGVVVGRHIEYRYVDFFAGTD